MTTHSSILAWRIPWTEEPGGLQSMGSHTSWTELKRLGTLAKGETQENCEIRRGKMQAAVECVYINNNTYSLVWYFSFKKLKAFCKHFFQLLTGIIFMSAELTQANFTFHDFIVYFYFPGQNIRSPMNQNYVALGIYANDTMKHLKFCQVGEDSSASLIQGENWSFQSS